MSISFIWQYGMTARQTEWLLNSTKAQRAAFMLSAPLRVACQQVISKEGQFSTLYLPTVHGVPIAQPKTTPEEAVYEGERQLERYRHNHDPNISIDIEALGLAGPVTQEYASPDEREHLFFAEAMRGFERIQRGENPYDDDPPAHT